MLVCGIESLLPELFQSSLSPETPECTSTINTHVQQIKQLHTCIVLLSSRSHMPLYCIAPNLHKSSHIEALNSSGPRMTIVVFYGPNPEALCNKKKL